MMLTTQFNRRWALLLLTALTRHGVRHICIAPGSRSTPLTLTAASNESFICHTHFDERGLGHLALGLAKAGAGAVAIIVTSGTATANLYPALIEADLTGERLIVLTADRPPEQIDCGANQAIRQQGLYGDKAVLRLDLPRPTADIPASWLVSAVDSAVARLQHGVLHINCPFAEPLYDKAEPVYDSWSETLGDWWQDSRPWLVEESYQAVRPQQDWLKWREKRGVVLVGHIKPQEGVSVAKWAKKLGWPLIGDALSQTGQPLPCADLWLAKPQAQALLSQAQLVIQFGISLTGKRLLQWQADCAPKEYWLIDPLPGRRDPAHHRGRRLCAPIMEWLKQHPADQRPQWAPALTSIAQETKETVDNYLANRFGEAQLACFMPSLLPKGGQLFLGNSLIIRMVDAFAKLPRGYPVFGNRGASGIEGLLSSAVGVHRAGNKPTLAVLGDISLIYDLNALALLRQTQTPFVLIVVNNNGGQIFSLLPTPQEVRERFYCMPQNVSFYHAANMFQLNYLCAQDFKQLKNAIQQAWLHQGASVVELSVPAKEGVSDFQTLLKQVAG